MCRFCHNALLHFQLLLCVEGVIFTITEPLKNMDVVLLQDTKS
jgi:hypothetical protein